MNSVRRISLVGKHKRARSGGGFVDLPPSPGLSGSVSLIAAAEVEKELSRLRCHIPSRLSRIRQVSNLHRHQQPLNYPNLHLMSRRIVSAFSGRSEASMPVAASNPNSARVDWPT